MTISLASIKSGKRKMPPRIVLHGPHGLGKSTFGSKAPKPIFIATEDGLGAIDTSAFPLATSHKNVLDATDVLQNEKHEYDTVVLDTADWAEALIWKQVCQEGGKDNIEVFGFQKGYVLAADLWRELLSKLDMLRHSKGMAVIITAHSQVKSFADPASADTYDRYIMKLHKTASALIQEWADIVAFCNQEIAVKKTDKGFNQTVGHGVVTGGRVMHLHPSPAFDAKERFGLPAVLPLQWSAFADAFTQATQT